ncbi:hypothetical protein BV898_12328 [Hypsibius exemplaris]|uniref:Gustatory receptor n=1 Tax=Hypsibius exemplaris TaxID=2072580 RepID=A0A1W0WE38_HYPEX|nr:hypothetical protein BV898_12328 [Hypsibius exemplaris]
MVVTPAFCYDKDVLPSYWIARIIGIHRRYSCQLSQKSSRWDTIKIILRCSLLVGRRVLTFVYLATCLLWAILFSICVFSYEMALFEKGKIKGTERESNIIIRLLDNIPWTAIMGRNILVLMIFYHRYPQMVQLTASLSRLLCIFDTSPRPLAYLARRAFRSLYLSWSIVTVNFLMLLMYYFNANFSDLFTVWNFAPFPMKLIGWQTAWCLLLMSYPPFLAAQVIIGSVVALAAGGLLLIRQLNKALAKLQEIRFVPRNNESSLGLSHGNGLNLDERGDSRDPHLEQLASLRLAHFEIAQYINMITEIFSELLLVVIAADFTAAVGYMGLLIGRPPSPNIVSFYFARIYHAIATLTWMGFYLCAQYWPLIILPEEAEKTYHYVQALSFNSLTPKTERWEREVMHFLLATKDTHMGVVAGKLLLFSRHLSVTMITLLCSYGVLVYELLHRSGAGESLSGAEHLQALADNSIGELGHGNTAHGNRSSGFAAAVSEALAEAVGSYQNMSLGAHTYD